MILLYFVFFAVITTYGFLDDYNDGYLTQVPSPSHGNPESIPWADTYEEWVWKQVPISQPPSPLPVSENPADLGLFVISSVE